MGPIKLKSWVWIAIIFRTLAAATQLSPHHPDEWFQTVEFGNYIAFGFLGHTQEVILHLRNLTWPALLAVILKIANGINPDSLFLKIYSVKFFTGILDLGILWGVYQHLQKWPSAWKQAMLALLILPYFTLAESVRPSQEHLSAISCWLALGLLPHPLWAGVFTVLTAAFRYPSGLFSLGLLCALLLQKRDQFYYKKFFIGMLVGVFLGSVTDWILYGRPWESLWMYLQFNVFTGISSQNFGSQSAIKEYGAYFRSYFGGIFMPLGLVSFVFVPIGVMHGLRKTQPWAFACLFYIVGHLLIPHKESRFMAPLLSFFLFSFLQGVLIVKKYFSKTIQRFSYLCIVSVFLLNFPFLMRALWGETWRVTSNYFEVSQYLKTYPVCAVISVRKPFSSLMIPNLAFGYYPAPSHEPSSQYLASRPLIWIEKKPEYFGDILLQVYQPEEFFGKKCKLLNSGPLKFLSESQKIFWIEKNWISAPWYLCPFSILDGFQKQEQRQIISKKIYAIKKLPSLGGGISEFYKATQEGLAPSFLKTQDVTLGDW